MKGDQKKGVSPEDKRHGKERTTTESGGLKDGESCRCKEVSKKSMSQLLKVAISDLSFWKKSK